MGAKESKKNDDSERISLMHEDEDTNSDIDFGVGIRSLAYSTIEQLRLPFDDANLKRLIPDTQIKFSIQDYILQKDKSCWYTLELEHGCFRWNIYKRFRDFVQLHHQLQMYRTFLSLQIPTINFEIDPESRRSFLVVQRKEIPAVPAFPMTSEILSRRKSLLWKMNILESYLQKVLKIPAFRNYHETLEFLEIGPYSFIEDLGMKGKEGFIRRRSNCGDTLFGIFCTVACGFWKKRWMFLKENFVGLIDPSRGQLECVLLLDKAFRTRGGKMRTGRSDGLVIQNLNKTLILQCESERQALDWIQELIFALDRGSADFVTPNRFESFAPPRDFIECKWIVDGATYFEAVALAIDAAKEEIFIADWWLSPEIYLRRPTTHGHHWQLDYLLRRKAREGVKIYVLLYKELELALGINSSHTEAKLSKMHPNIQVMRHPNVSKGVLLWAHHEKIVCVDQTYALVGGLDLCYGRWDDYQHRLTDLGETDEKLKVLRHMSLFPKLSSMGDSKRRTSSLPHFSEELFLDQEKVENLKDEEIVKNLLYEEIIGNILDEETAGNIYIEENKISPKDMKERSKFQKAFKKLQARTIFEGLKRQLSLEASSQEKPSDMMVFPDQPADIHRTVQEMALTYLGLERKFRLWHGKDYANFISRDFENLEQPYTDTIDRSTTPRMPWHDVGLYVQGPTARDIARHFILRWNHAKEENCPKDNSKPFLMPKSYAALIGNTPAFLQNAVGSLYRAECQVLRSLGFWSGNISDTEDSIHKAYTAVIRKAEKFIYIENQFFISQPAGNGTVYNGIADALFNRILKAYRDRKPFRVYVVLPLLPAFEGEVGTGSGTLIQAITHWNYKSMCRGPDSLIGRLSRHMRDPSKYIGFYGLRTYDILGNKPVTELVYVHSKMLIADDRVAIIGSANINDRSMLGRRDSEIAVIVTDTNFLDDPYGAGHFCYSLRTALFREHLGLMKLTDSRTDLRDPSSSKFYKDVWDKIAASNTEIYEEVFRCLPSDNVTSFDDLRRYVNTCGLASSRPVAAIEKLQNIQGFLVQFPLQFLRDERLKPDRTKKEHYLPSSVFT